jgi:hypothetical protein
MARHNRTAADYGNIVISEIDGKEERGATARLIAEARGEKPSTESEGGSLGALTKIVDLLGNDKSFKARLAGNTRPIVR